MHIFLQSFQISYFDFISTFEILYYSIVFWSDAIFDKSVSNNFYLVFNFPVSWLHMAADKLHMTEYGCW